MKNLLLSVFVLAGISAQSQVTFNPGLRTGLNLTTVGELDASYKTDFYISAFGALNLTRVYTLQPEMGYSRQGAKDIIYQEYNDYNGYGPTRTVDLELNYLTLSLVNRFNIAGSYHLLVGPTFDILMSENMPYRENDVDMGISFGMGYKSPSGFGVDARIKQGIIDTVPSDFYGGHNGFFFGDYNTNTVIQLGVFYMFDIKTNTDTENVD